MIKSKKQTKHLTLTDSENLVRAWKWVRSNPDKSYKNYFRDAYSIFALADRENLIKIKEQLEQTTYEPGLACKVYLPKWLV